MNDEGREQEVGSDGGRMSGLRMCANVGRTNGSGGSIHAGLMRLRGPKARKKDVKMTKRSRYLIENKEKWPKNEPKTNRIFRPNEPNFLANEAIFQAIQPLLEAPEPDTKPSGKMETRSPEFGT